jgi:hypothetical protein
MWRRFVAISTVAFLLQFFSVCTFSQMASPKAKTGTDQTDFCWRDSATGNYIPTTPIGATPQDYIPGDDHWENPRNSKTYVHLPDRSWIDAKTGNPVPTEPLGASPTDFIPGETHWENPRNGKTYFRVPCPPPTPSTTNPPAPPPPPSHAAPPTQQPAAPSAPVVYQPPIYGTICWYRLGESLPISTKDMYPSGSVPDPNDPNHATNFSTGTDFVRRTDGTWTNSGTGNSIPDDQLTPFGHPESPGDPGKAYEPSFPDRAGRAWRKGPCPPPANSLLPYTLAPGFTTYISVTFGVFGRTDTYDDNYSIGGTTFAPGVSVEMPHIFVVKNKLGGYFGGFDIVGELPTEEAKRDTTITKLTGIVISDLLFGIRTQIQKRTVDVSVGAGGAVGVVRSGFDSPGYSYSDTEPLPGISVFGAASTPITPRLSGVMEVRYIDLFSATFGSPGGSYNMKDTSISGRIGIQFNLHK